MPQKVLQKDSDLRPGPYGESLDLFSFSKIVPPLVGVNPKKYFEVTQRDQREAHAKFSWNPSSGLASKSEQTNKQTDRQASFILYRLMNYYTFSDIFPVRPKHPWASNGHIGGDRGWGGVCDSSELWAFFWLCVEKRQMGGGGLNPLSLPCVFLSYNSQIYFG